MSDSTPSPHHSTTAPPNDAVSVAPSNREQPQYGCPLCDATYAHEVFTRVHITRADDDPHDSRDGFGSDTEDLIGAAGGNSTRGQYSPEEVDPSSVTREDFPDEFSAKAVSALLVATRNPTLTDRTALTEQVHGELADRAREPPIERTVDQAVTRFHHPQFCGDREAPTFATLTTKQQAI